MTVFIGRQPIISRDAEVIGYELLYRENNLNICDLAASFDATERIINSNGLQYGVDHITEGKKALINFSEKALLNGVAQKLPVNNVVIEILETVSPSDEVFEVCHELVSLGYELALDDFVYDESWVRFVEIVQIIKIDIIATPLESIGGLINAVKKMKQSNIATAPKLLAEKIETSVEYEKAKELGFDFFQGYLFGRPEMIISKAGTRLSA
jgi:EAL and modified HD-GYP domain-containing signal transduction protein